jgi:hypothetical protein
VAEFLILRGPAGKRHLAMDLVTVQFEKGFVSGHRFSDATQGHKSERL